jgi:hypothetical protein
MDLHVLGNLRDEGWALSYRTRRSVDGKGRPIPWYTYACKDFLERRLNRDLRVFEYGCGNSTLWLARFVGEVVSVEHHPGWAAEVGANAPPNVRIVRADEGDDYVRAIESEGVFDVVVVDGLERGRCALHAVASLSEGGVIVWDDSAWQEFTETWPGLESQGFRELDFSGLGPISRDKSRTSVLYRDGNCLGI